MLYGIMPFEFEPIGILESCFRERFGTPRQPHLVPHSRAQLKIRSDLNPSQVLDGLSHFSHAWLIFIFHQNTNKTLKPKVHPPRLGGATMGLFATRSPHRPNPIGLSLVCIQRLEQDTIYFSEIDLIDGTPILDIKPYIRESDSRPDARDSWAGAVEWKKWRVLWKENVALTFLNLKMPDGCSHEDMRCLINECVSQDPRPLVYREDVEQKYRDHHYITIYNLNVRFAFEDENIWIEGVEAI